MKPRDSMKQHGTWVCFLACVCGMATTASSQTEAKTLCVMTFNLRYASATPPNSWPQRRPVMKECVESVSPDVMGTQEGLYHQLKDLAADLPGYAWIGLGRNGGSHSEFMAVFYRTNRLDPLEYDHFWLSDTPNVVGSSTWGNANRRMVTWIRFKDLQSGGEFYFANTHLDHEIQTAREKAAGLIKERLALLDPKLPLILAGDFNATAGANKAYDLLVSEVGLTDSWLAARVRKEPIVRTFHNFRGPVPGDNRIDWILTRGNISTESSQIITFSRDGQFPSDHFPVVSWVRVNQAQ